MIEFRSVTFGYQNAESQVLTRATFRAAAGEFVLVCGPTGSGKSTLLKLVNGLAPHFTGGILRGQILVDEEDVTGLKPHELASTVGFVNQQPEGSFVADTVAEEIAYGLEQLGVPTEEMHKRVAEVASLVGLSDLLTHELQTLSGGQQQRVAIAAAIVAGQKVLILDEPTSALDAKSTADIVKLLSHLAKSRGITILLAEHRLERVIAEVDSVLVVNGDSSVVKSKPRDAFKDYRLLPPVVEYSKVMGLDPVALSVSEARERSASATSFEPLHKVASDVTALEVANVTVIFDEKLALNNVSISANRGEVVAVMGANGSGKSTLLWSIQGFQKLNSGQVNFTDTVTMVPQRASDLLFLNSLAEELEEADREADASTGSTAAIFLKLSNRTDTKQHPRDLSAGQQLALALSVQLVKGAKIVLLDEPTRGLDYEAKRHLAKTIRELSEQGNTFLVASHDVEFVAQISSKVYLLEDGVIRRSGSVEDLLGYDGELPTQVAKIAQTPGLLLAEQLAVQP